MKFVSYLCFIFLLLLIQTTTATASTIQIKTTVPHPLVDRIQQFPQWQNKPSVQLADGDLEYPEWMAGTWKVTSTLVEQFAPLAPKVVTPGFKENQQYLDRSIQFQVKFAEKYSPKQTKLPVPSLIPGKLAIVADRAFNGLNIAQAYLGDRYVLSVKIDPNNPNKQITSLKGNNKLTSTVTGRATEIPTEDKFIATEVTQQLFRNQTRIYLNEVETTTEYQLIKPGQIEAKQITAIYLSPQDPDYFTAANLPVALYRYHLQLASIVKEV